MNNFSFYFFLFICSFLFHNCTSKSNIDLSEAHFFDLTNYFEIEIAKLKEVKTIKKQTVFDGIKEEKILDSLNFKSELTPFISSNINKNAWFDKYQVDSIFNNTKQLNAIHYLATDKDLKTQSLKIEFNKDQNVSMIEIQNSSKNSIYYSKQILVYKQGIGYSIQYKQKTNFSPVHESLVTVSFLH